MHQDAELERHVEPCQRILMFFARTQVPHEWESPAYRFNRQQRAAWEALWRAAQDHRDRPEPMETEEGEEGDDDADPLQPVEARCMEFFIELLNQRIQFSEYECALVCALAVLGVGDHEGGKPWKDAHSYPPILSKVIKMSRFMIVHKAFLLDPNGREILRAERGRLEGEWTVPSPMEDAEYRFGDDEGYSGSPPTTPPPAAVGPPRWSSSPGFSSPPRLISLSQPAQQGRKTFREWIRIMVTTFMVHGTASPMEWMMDLRRYGMKIHYNTPSDGHIGWEGDDQLSYKTLKFTMGHFRGFVHGLAASTRQILVEKVLMCTPDQIPAIPWDRMGDDFNEPKAGWSFLQDPRTPWPVHGPRWMSQRVRQERKLQQWFIQPREGRFSIDGIERFMGFVAEFKEKLAVLCHITSGQPARGPELLSIRHRNAAAGGQRNIFIEDGLVACVTRYHKGFYASNDAKVIHRYLPRAVGELVVWYLWLVLPFVEQLQAYHQQMCQSAAIPDTQASKVWGVDAVTGREWTSVRLRDALARESKKRLHNALNLASYRDIAIAISRRYFSNAKPFPHNVREDGTAVDGDGDGEVDEDAMDDEQWMRHVADLQAAHTPHVAEDGVRADDEPAAGDDGGSAGRVSGEQRPLAWVFKVRCPRYGRPHVGQASPAAVEGRGGDDAGPAAGFSGADQHDGGDAADDGPARDAVPADPGGGDPVHPSRGRPRGGRDAHERREEHVIHVAGVGGGAWGVNGGGRAVDVVTAGFARAVPGVRHFVRGMGEPPASRPCAGRIGHARVGIHRRVPDVFEPVA
jgi:hypothetical protein